MWTKIRNLNEILDKIGDSGWTKNEFWTTYFLCPYSWW